MPDRLGPGDHREWLHAMVESAMDAIISVDVKQRVLVFNKAAEDIFKISAKDIVGKEITQLIPDRFRASHNASFERFAASGERSLRVGPDSAMIGLRSDGTEFPFDATVNRAQVGQRAVYTIIMRDISEQKGIEQKMTHLQKMEALGRLAGGIAHDFNNLLLIIRANVEMTLSGGLGPERTKLNLHSVLEAVERGSSLVGQLMVFSRERPKEFTQVNVNSLFAAVEKMVTRLIGENISLIVRWSRANSPIVGDEYQLFQALINLIVNSKDAMPNGGTITLGSEMVELDEHYARLHPNVTPGRYIMISVEDTGTGMPESVKQRMFDPFYTTKPEGKGTGLGLSIVMGTVHDSKGHIAVYTEVGKGTAIKLFFPMIEPKPVEAATDAEFDSGVLVVEDEMALRGILCEVLISRGYSVLEAKNGTEAIEIAKRHQNRIGVVISDLVMPTMGGIEMVGRLRKILPRFALILMSGYSEVSDDTAALLSDPIIRLLRKPFPMEEMISTITELTKKLV